MNKNIPIYYWDSCIFLEWFQQTTGQDPALHTSIGEIISEFDAGKCSIITSTVTLTEILPSKNMGKRKFDLFTAFLRCDGVHLQAANHRVCNLAGDLRDYYIAKSDQYGGKTLSAMDAIHLATAITFNVNAFHTNDGKGRGKTLGLLLLSGQVADKYRLKIAKPSTNQANLGI